MAALQDDVIPREPWAWAMYDFANSGFTTVADLSLPGAQPPLPQLAAQNLAFLQYTSGSTGNPKGVVLTHANLLANLRAMEQASGITAEDIFVSWLPLHHDMGLIGACMGKSGDWLQIGFSLILMSPLAFLARAQRWLATIHRHRATVSAAPNFAYELCANKLDEHDLAGLTFPAGGSLTTAPNLSARTPWRVLPRVSALAASTQQP